MTTVNPSSDPYRPDDPGLITDDEVEARLQQVLRAAPEVRAERLASEARAAVDQDLDTAIRLFEEALDLAGQHRDSAGWLFELGLAYRDRASRTAARPDLERSAGCLRRVRDRLPVDDPARDEATAALAEVYFDQALLTPPDATPRLDELRGVLERLHELRSEARPRDLAHYLDLIIAAARLEIGEIGGGEDLDTAIAATETALAHPAGNTKAVPFVRMSLANAYRLRFARKQHLPDIDRAIDIARRDLTDAADPTRLLFLASAHHDRFDAADTTADLDRAIDLYSRAGDPEADLQHGSLLGIRAQRNRSAADARAAAELLERAASATGASAARGLLWGLTAEAHRLVHVLDKDKPALDRADDLINWALTQQTAGDNTLEMHYTRLQISYTRWHEEGGRAAGWPRIAAMLAEADAALTALSGRDQNQEAWLATLIALTGLNTGSGVPDVSSVARAQRLLHEHEVAIAGLPDLQPMVSAVRAMLSMFESAAGHVDRLVPASGPANVHLRQQATARAARWRGEEARRDSAVRDHVDALTALQGIIDHLQTGDTAGAAETMRAVLPGLERISGTGVDANAITILRATAEMIDPTAFPMPDQPAQRGAPGPSGTLGNLASFATLGATLTRGLARDDLRALERAAAIGRDLLDRAGPDDDRLASAAAALAGMAELAMSRRVRPTGPALTRALSLLDSAQARSGGPHSPWWSRIAMLQAQALRAVPEPDLTASRAAGLRALTGHNWRAIATAGGPDAASAREQAWRDARTLQDWCVADLGADPQALDDLIGALDAEQAITTGATAATRPVADRLSSLGRHDLAAEWRSTAGQSRDLIAAATWISPLGGPPADEASPVLVDRTLRALDADLEPITASGIASVLRETGQDALIYLVARTAGTVDLAVVVHRDRPPSSVRFTGLAIPRLPDVPSAEDFERISAWAGTGVLTTVLRAAAMSPERLVLIATGPVARIPWHAALDESRTGRRYLLESCSVAYTPSARALLDAVRSRPTGSAASLAVGAGRPGGRPVTPDLPDWIGTHRGQPASVYLGYPVEADPSDPRGARFVLPGGKTLGVKDLQAQAENAGVRWADVFLPKAPSGGHLSPAQSFAAAGARSVIGTLWPVPDVHAAELTEHVYQSLRAGVPAAAALRNAQLHLRERGVAPTSWAAYVHFGV